MTDNNIIENTLVIEESNVLSLDQVVDQVLDQVVEQSNQVKVRKPRKLKEPVKTKVCKICKQEKSIDEFALNEIINRVVRMKNICLICLNNLSKDNYKKNKDKILKENKEKYNNNKKKTYKVSIKFNNIDEFKEKLKIITDKIDINQLDDFKFIMNKKDKKDI